MNTTIKRVATLGASVVVLAGAMLFGQAGRAAGAPYGTSSLGVYVSASDPCPGQQIVVRVTGGVPGDTVTIDVDSSAASVATLIVDASGVAGGVITIPRDAIGAHEVLATTGGVKASAAITISDANSPDNCIATSTSLASTGADVISIGTFAATLLGGGALLLCFGRRRTNTRSARRTYSAR